MDLKEFKASLLEAEQEANKVHEGFAKQSAAHSAALQIMQFEKNLYYGDIVQSKHLQKVRSIIEDHAEDINNEID